MTRWEIEADIQQIGALERRAHFTTAFALSMKLNSQGGKRPPKPSPDGTPADPPLQDFERFDPLELLGWTDTNLEAAGPSSKLIDFDPIALYGIELAATDGLLSRDAWNELMPIWNRVEFTLNHHGIGMKGG
jgi:hypothetical protein